MRAVFFGWGGGGSRETELTGAVLLGESRATAPRETNQRVLVFKKDKLIIKRCK